LDIDTHSKLSTMTDERGKIEELKTPRRLGLPTVLERDAVTQAGVFAAHKEK
jgi:hypothetical protein